MPRRDEQIYEERRQQILRGALAVFAEKGFEKATNRDIARAAGIGSPGLIYHYFEDKAHLFGCVIEQHAPGLQLIAAGDPTLNGPPHETLTLLGHLFLTTLTDHPRRAFFRMILGEAMRRPALADLIGELGPQRAFAFLSSYLSAQMDAGILRRTDPGIAVRCFIGPLFAYVLTREMFPMPDTAGLTPDAMVDAAVETFLRGMDYGFPQPAPAGAAGPSGDV